MAENSGGAHCFKYGFTTNYVTGLEVVLPDGEVVQLGGKELDPPGYDLLGAFVGSEGTLGVATKITLRVVPVARGGADAGRVLRLHPRRRRGRVARSCSAGSCPGAIEMMDKLAIEASEQMAHAGYPLGRGAALLVELDGAEHECEARFEEVVGDLRAPRRRRRARGPGRGRAPADLEDAQGRLRGHGPHLARTTTCRTA